jgi:hypothetical protein
LVVDIDPTCPGPFTSVTVVPLTLPTTAPNGIPAPKTDIPGTTPAASAALDNVTLELALVTAPIDVRPMFGVTPKYAFAAPVVLGAVESVTVVPSTTDATVVPNEIPGPCTG